MRPHRQPRGPARLISCQDDNTTVNQPDRINTPCLSLKRLAKAPSPELPGRMVRSWGILDCGVKMAMPSVCSESMQFTHTCALTHHAAFGVHPDLIQVKTSCIAVAQCSRQARGSNEHEALPTRPDQNPGTPVKQRALWPGTSGQERGLVGQDELTSTGVVDDACCSSADPWALRSAGPSS